MTRIGCITRVALADASKRSITGDTSSGLGAIARRGMNVARKKLENPLFWPRESALTKSSNIHAAARPIFSEVDRLPPVAITGEIMRRSFNKVALPTKTIGTLAAAATAAALGALWVEHRARKAERDNPPAGPFVEVDGVPLHYVDKGTGPAVVLLHGNAVLLQDFIASGLVDRLAERYRVIAFDRPGFGYSGRPRGRLWTAQAQAALIQQALVQIGVVKPVVLGHSWGTLVALGMAADRAADVRGLVLVSGYYYPTARVDVALTAPAALPVVGDILRYTASPLTGRLLLKRAVEAMFAPLPMPADFFDFVSREMILRPVQLKADAEDAAFMVPAAAKYSALYPNLKMPVSIFAGADDKVIDPQSNSVRLHREITHSTLVIAPGAGHMAHYAVPDEIVEAIDLMSSDQQSVEPGDSQATIDDASAAAEMHRA